MYPPLSSKGSAMGMIHPTVYFIKGATTEFDRGGGAHSHTGDYSPLLPARLLNFGEKPASIGNLVSSLSQSKSNRFAKKHAAGVTENSAHKRPARCKKDADDLKDDEDDDNDGEEAVIPVTDQGDIIGAHTVEERRAVEQRDVALIEAHCQEFMRRVFPSKEIPTSIPQLTAVGTI
jgi:hypothetical protein